jgi:hypothetical protein
LAGLQRALGLSEPDRVFDELAAKNGRMLLLVDTAELLMPLDSWLRDIFLPRLPGNVLVVIAGRKPPSLRWRTDPGWQRFMRVVPLKNLNQEESRAFLMRRQLPARQHEAILQFTTVIPWPSRWWPTFLNSSPTPSSSLKMRPTSSKPCWPSLCRKRPPPSTVPPWKPVRRCG